MSTFDYSHNCSTELDISCDEKIGMMESYQAPKAKATERIILFLIGNCSFHRIGTG
jgi:hypothetical protein